MKLFLHLDEKLIIVIEDIQIWHYYDAIGKLKDSKIKLIENEIRFIDYSKLPEKCEMENVDIWKYKYDYYFAMTNEFGSKTVFIPEIHLDYAEKHQTRQGFHIFFEYGETGLSKEITLKFYYESQKVFILTIETFKAMIEKLFIVNESVSKQILYKDMLVLIENSQEFYLKSEDDLKILRTLLFNKNPKIKIVLREPQSKISFTIISQNNRYELPLLKSSEILLFLLRNEADIRYQYELNPNINDQNIYNQLEPNSNIDIIEVQETVSHVRKIRCKCGGYKENNRCQTKNCRNN